MKKAVSSVLTLLGAALLVFAIALPTYVVPKGKVFPTDIVSTTPTEIVESNLLDSGALAKGEPVKSQANRPECAKDNDNKPLNCFIHKGIEMQSQRFLTAEEPANDEVVTLSAALTLFRKDIPEPRNLVNATVDRVTYDRKTQLPIDEPVATFDVNPPIGQKDGEEGKASIGPNVRKGITYQFPMGTDRRSYDYFDLQSQTVNPIDYAGEEELNGLTVYRFEQQLGPIDLYERMKELLNEDGELSKADESTLAALRLGFPASQWGLDKDEIVESAVKKPEKAPENAEEAEGDDDPVVEMDRFYTVNRTVWIEPNTGVIMNGREEIFQYYAQNQEDADKINENREEEIANPTRTATYFPGQWNEDARAGQYAKAKDGLDRMNLMGKTVPWILGPLGLILLVIGFFIATRANKN